MKSILNQNIIDKYILDEFGEIPNPPTKDEMLELIYDNNLILEKVKLWVLFGGDLMIKDNNEYTILHSASWVGQLDIVQYVLDKGDNVDCLNDINSTPLILASINGHIKIINYLLDKGANINHQCKWGWTALHWACMWNQLESVKVLVERGIDIHLKGHYNNQNKTVLDVAIYRNYQEIVDYLTPFYN